MIICSACCFAADASAADSRLLWVKSDSALRIASSFNSLASTSAASIYLRPRDSAPERIDFALASEPSSFSFAIRTASATFRSADAIARDSRCCAVLMSDIAVSVARISNSSLESVVISRRERRSASWDSSWRIRSTAFSVGTVSTSPLKPTQLRNLFSAI